MKNIYINLTVVVVAVMCACGCRTTKAVLHDYNGNIVTGGYAQASIEVSELSQDSGRDQLLWRLLSANAYYLCDRRGEAIKQFDFAEDVFEDYAKSSVFARGGEGTFAMIYNDTAFSYDGGGEDRVFVCLYKAVDYMVSGNIAACRTELSRAGEYQERWKEERSNDIVLAEEKFDKAESAKAEEDKIDVAEQRAYVSKIISDSTFQSEMERQYGFNVFSSGDLNRMQRGDYVNPYLQHVTGIFRWINPEDRGNGASESLSHVAELVNNETVKRDHEECSSRMKPMNQIWIYAEDGLCPCREEFVVHLPLALIPYVSRYVKYAGVAFPRLKKNPPASQRWMVKVSGKGQSFGVIADIDKLVKTEYDVYMRGAVKREITRVVSKILVQTAAGVAAERFEESARKKEKNGEDGSDDRRNALIARMAQWFAVGWSWYATAADVRSWTSLPKCVRMVRIDRPADGKLSVKTDTETIELNVPEGNSIVFLRKPAPGAKTVVKQVTYPNL